jgi:hypothetical protein
MKSLNYARLGMALGALLLPAGLHAQTSIIGPNQYAFQYQPVAVPSLVGLFFNATDSRFEFRDASGNAELFINPINQFSNFRGKLGVNAINPPSTFQVVGSSRMGTATDYAEVDAAGNLRFTGNARYIVPGNTYAFQAQGSQIGLFFNQALNRYEFRNSAGGAVLTLGATGGPAGHLAVTGNVTAGGAETLARISAETSTVSQQAAVRGRGQNDFTGGYLGALGTSAFDGSLLNIAGFEVGVLGLSYGSTSLSIDNYGLYGYSDNVGVRGENQGGNFAELGRSDFALLTSGPSRMQGQLTADGGSFTSLLINSNLDPVPAVDGPLSVGTTAGPRLNLYRNSLQAVNTLGTSSLDLNPLGGNVNIGQGGGNINLASTGAGSVVVATGGGNFNASNLLYTNSSTSRVGVRTPTPAYTLTVRHAPGTLSKNGIALINELNNNTWNFYTYVDGRLGFFFADSLRASIDNVSGLYTSVSDAALKEGVEPIGSVREQLARLQPRTFRYKADPDGHTYYGLVAQELEQVFPGLVHLDRETGLRTVSYTELIPLMLAGMQEQAQREAAMQQEHATEIEALRYALDLALERLDQLESAMTACCNSQGDAQGRNVDPDGGSGSLHPAGSPQPWSDARLGQNIPNPFQASTEIPYFLPEGIERAEIRVLDAEGRLRHRWTLSQPGNGRVQLQHPGWPAGSYVYGLFLNGQPVAVRTMHLN